MARVTRVRFHPPWAKGSTSSPQLILDGNHRHERSLGLTDPRAIYRLGAQKLDDMLDWCAELTVSVVTLWVFSTDNLQRPPEEVTGISCPTRKFIVGARACAPLASSRLFLPQRSRRSNRQNKRRAPMTPWSSTLPLLTAGVRRSSIRFAPACATWHPRAPRCPKRSNVSRRMRLQDTSTGSSRHARVAGFVDDANALLDLANLLPIDGSEFFTACLAHGPGQR